MLFLFTKSDICNFADDSTLSSCEKILGDMMPNLKFDFGHILKLFQVNSLKPNAGKFQFMILGTNTSIKVNLFLDGNRIEKFKEVALLGSFKAHIENICRKAKYNLRALQRARN